MVALVTGCYWLDKQRLTTYRVLCQHLLFIAGIPQHDLIVDQQRVLVLQCGSWNTNLDKTIVIVNLFANTFGTPCAILTSLSETRSVWITYQSVARKWCLMCPKQMSSSDTTIMVTGAWELTKLCGHKNGGHLNLDELDIV